MDLILFWNRKLHHHRKTFDGLALGAAKMEMIVWNGFLITFHANSKILLSIISYDAVNNLILAVAVQNPIHCCPVCLYVHLADDRLLAHCLFGIGQYRQYRLLG